MSPLRPRADSMGTLGPSLNRRGHHSSSGSRSSGALAGSKLKRFAICKVLDPAPAGGSGLSAHGTIYPGLKGHHLNIQGGMEGSQSSCFPDASAARARQTARRPPAVGSGPLKLGGAEGALPSEVGSEQSPRSRCFSFVVSGWSAFSAAAPREGEGGGGGGER